MSRRAEALELAVLGLLHDAPMHGYELRKRVNALLGWGRAFSYGTLYPCLKDLVRRGYLAEDTPVGSGSVRSGAVRSGAAPGAGGLAGRRGKIVYRLTPEGKEHFADLLGRAGPASWEDEQFGVHFAFFARADSATRMRILEGRRSRLQERLDTFRTSLQRTRARLDAYTLELQRHGLESVEREVRWLDELIEVERRGAPVRRSDAVWPEGFGGTAQPGSQPTVRPGRRPTERRVPGQETTTRSRGVSRAGAGDPPDHSAT